MSRSASNLYENPNVLGDLSRSPEADDRLKTGDRHKGSRALCARSRNVKSTIARNLESTIALISKNPIAINIKVRSPQLPSARKRKVRSLVIQRNTITLFFKAIDNYSIEQN
jgi:hypothetical protein